MIKKYIASFTLTAFYAYATMINGISMTVDNEPITLYEIHSFTKQYNVPVSDAVNRLVQKKIEDIEIQKMNLVASPEEVDSKMQELAKQNNLSYEQFKQALVSEGHTEESLKEDIEEKFKRDKLYQKIIGAQIKKPDIEEMRSYYDLHIDRFKMPGSVQLIEYLSSSAKSLEIQKRQPMVKMPNIQTSQKTIDLKGINPQLSTLLVRTPEGSFTPVLNLGEQSGMFFINKKIGTKTASFQEAQQTLFEMLMKEKEQAVVIEFFEKKKSEANIKVVRRP